LKKRIDCALGKDIGKENVRNKRKKPESAQTLMLDMCQLLGSRQGSGTLGVAKRDEKDP